MADNYKDSDQDGLEIKVAQIRMAFVEAEINNLDVVFITTQESIGVVGGVVFDWLKTMKRDYQGRVSILCNENIIARVEGWHGSLQISEIHDSIKSGDFKEILLIGSDISVLNINGRIYVNRIGAFVDSGRKISRSILKITTLLKQKNEQGE